MSLTAGTVTVGTDESVTGSGAALAIFNARVVLETSAGSMPDPAARPASMTAAQWSTIALSSRLALLRQWARESTAAGAGVTYLVANAVVITTISTSTGALQQAAGVDTTAPTAPRTLPGTIT